MDSVVALTTSPSRGGWRAHSPRRGYAEPGVPLALFADPQSRSVHVFRGGAEAGPLRGGDVIEFGDILPGFAPTVDELFAPLRADWQ